MSTASPRGFELATELSHIDARGHAVMVDVTNKQATRRRAEARGRVAGVGDLSLLSDRGSAILTIAKAAGLLGAKRCSALIPLCHPLPLTSLDVEFALSSDAVEIYAVAETLGQTGVEMEALVGCTFAALSIVHELRSTAASAVIEDVAVWEKSGGRSGHWLRQGRDDVDVI